METCSRCKSVLPRAADLCQVCGAPVGLAATPVTDPSAAWQRDPSNRPVSISADDFLSDLLAPSTPAPAPPPRHETDPSSLEPNDFESSATSWRAMPPPRTPPDDDHRHDDEDDDAGDHPDPVEGPYSPFEPVWAEHDHTDRPRRTGHDGATRSIDATDYSPVPDRTPTTALAELPTRAVPALSSRVSANLSMGPGRRHHLVSTSMGILALVLFLGGLAAGLLLDADDLVAADAASDGSGLDAGTTADVIDPAAALAAARSSLITVTYAGCDTVPVAGGGMLVTNDSTVVVPFASEPPTSEVIVTAAGGYIGGTIVGWGTNGRLAIVRLHQPADLPPLTWASANRVTPGAGLTMLTFENGTWSASKAVADGVDRNTDGVMARIRVAEGSLVGTSIALDSEGLVVGIVPPGETMAVAASDDLRPTLAMFLTTGGWTPAPCPAAPGTGVPAVGD